MLFSKEFLSLFRNLNLFSFPPCVVLFGWHERTRPHLCVLLPCWAGAGSLGDVGSLRVFSAIPLSPPSSFPQPRVTPRDDRGEGFREETAGRRAGWRELSREEVVDSWRGIRAPSVMAIWSELSLFITAHREMLRTLSPRNYIDEQLMMTSEQKRIGLFILLIRIIKQTIITPIY